MLFDTGRLGNASAAAAEFHRDDKLDDGEVNAGKAGEVSLVEDKASSNAIKV